MTKGFTLIEVLIAAFVFAVLSVGIFGLLGLILRSNHDSQRRIIATALANEKMEMARNLPYESVGTVGGVPAGPIVQSEQITRSGSAYTVETDIRYIDDPFDGTSTSDPVDTVNTDYKQVRVEVSFAGRVSSRPVLLITQVSSQGIESGDSLGTLVFQALNAAGIGVAGATVHLVNASLSPVLDFTTSTNNEGLVTIPGLTPSAGTYEISVTKNGYTSEQTYNATSTFIPDVDHSHLNALAGEVTNKTFSIDAVSSVSIQTQSDTEAVIGNVPFTIQGTKKIGTDDLGIPVYQFSREDTTDVSGIFSYANMTWDTYSFSIDGVISGYDIKETNVPLPLILVPGAAVQLTAALVPHQEFTLHATVLDITGAPVANATVHLTGVGYDETLQTTQYGQVFFTPIGTAGDFEITVDAPGYQQVVQLVTIDAGVRLQIIINSI
ncbi:MAG: carboxypeptidase regulatory-like domain-containing protein [bacterium]|nr:carboxypeptidase regulatory-like domain-containing protein [bacterium]